MSDASWATPKALLDLWRAIAGAGPRPEAVLDTLAEKLAALLGDGIAIDLVAEDGTLRRAAAGGPSGNEARGPVEEVIRTGCAQLIRATAPDAPSLIVVPLQGPEEVLGAVTAMRRASSYDQADLGALQEIASCAGLAFGKARAEARTAERTEALAASEAWLRHLVESSPAIIFVKDLEGRYVTVNKRCEQNMGRSPRGADRQDRLRHPPPATSRSRFTASTAR